ncbi:MAG TPA: FAD-binding protein [Burkholderiales bacterium]|jgi:FAD/FMN-containing dehydrogenase|nr:FAD-binding protein [Burkholderiales bacterium]
MNATLAFPRSGDLRAARSPSTVPVRSADELRRALRAARERALTLDVSGLNRMLRLDGQRRQIELQAATSWSAVAAYLVEHGVASAAAGLAGNLAGSVGEAVSENGPGPDGTPMSLHVEAITLVTAEGDVRRADRHANSDLFALAIGGHDLIGVLYSVTLRIDSLSRAVNRAEPPIVLDLGQSVPPGGVARKAEFLVPPEQLDAVLASFKDVASERRIHLESVTVRRLQPEHETFLRWATREWAEVTLRYSVRPTLSACVHATEIERLLLDTVVASGGSFRIGAAQHPSMEQLERCYPKLGAFIAEKKRYDPAERLQNAWYRRLAAQLRHEGRD